MVSLCSVGHMVRTRVVGASLGLPLLLWCLLWNLRRRIEMSPLLSLFFFSPTSGVFEFFVAAKRTCNDLPAVDRVVLGRGGLCRFPLVAWHCVTITRSVCHACPLYHVQFHPFLRRRDFGDMGSCLQHPSKHFYQDVHPYCVCARCWTSSPIEMPRRHMWRWQSRRPCSALW